MWVSTAPGVAIRCSPEIISVFDEMIMSTSSMMCGLPDLPIFAILPSLIPISALIIPITESITMTFVMTVSTDDSGFTPLDCASPSRMLFPPPKTASSP